MKKLSISLLITIMCFSVSISSYAASWERIAESSIETFFVDTDSITGDADGPKEAWFKQEYKTPDCTSEFAKNRNKCVNAKLFYERYFINKSSCTLQMDSLFTDGTTYSSTSLCNKRKNDPDSIGETMWSALYRKPATTDKLQ